MPRIHIHEEGILHLLTNLKLHKASGPDGIPSCLLKLIAHQITPTLKVIFQTSLDKSCLPEDWKCANVVPIFKKKDRSSPTNYRPVLLTSICCKVLEHIIYSNISQHLKPTTYCVMNNMVLEQNGLARLNSFPLYMILLKI